MPAASSEYEIDRGGAKVLLDHVLDGAPLTRTADAPEQVRNLGEQAAWLRDARWSWAAIARKLGIGPRTAQHVVSLVGGDAGRGWLRHPEKVDRTCELRAQGLSFTQIADALGICQPTAVAYVELAAPELRHVPEIARRGGQPPGCGCHLTDDQLRELHSSGASASEIGRQLAARGLYASWKSAAQGVCRGWRRLGLPVRRSGDCAAVKRQGTGRGLPCARPSLLGSRYCYVHEPSNQRLMTERAAAMRDARGTRPS